MRRYYLHTRHGGIFYAELVTASGLKLTARSTGTKNRDEALMIVADWIKGGIPAGKSHKRQPLETATALPEIIRTIKRTELDAEGAMSIVSALRERALVDFGITKAGPGREKFIPFLFRFWDAEKSPYLREKKAHGHRLTKKYCRNMGQIVERHWRPYFGDSLAINSVTRESLREFSLSLYDKGLAGSTVNNLMIAGTTPLRWVYSEGVIPAGPASGLMTFTGNKVSRDILTEEETEALFRADWQDKRAYVAALVSLTTGIRSGEVRGLRRDSIGEAVLDVSYSWNDTEGLKRPKNGEPRRAPLLPEVRGLLLDLLEETPHQDLENPFVFYSPDPEKPCSAELFRRNFRRACKAVSENPPGWARSAGEAEGTGCLWVSKAENGKPWGTPESAEGIVAETCFEYRYRRSANKPGVPLYIDLENKKIDFHSFRHHYASRMADHMAADKVARITGHRSKAAAKIYQDHITKRILTEAASEAAQEFGNVLRFAKNGA
ncbi:MAG: integrase [Treponema sp.]|jgi:integrase|nr:integrase [Treponema sp.]